VTQLKVLIQICSVSTTGVMTEDPQILIDALKWYDTNNGGKVPFDSTNSIATPGAGVKA
jgi:Ca2+-binding EF-hand superfamily protein